ncbi:MAG TPA: DNA starvation/stationary phase protection protein, partial [Candidatus Acidoferrales bacterium]|nr:DNA starvation/stationary phase protection protein [Candidatus Acidoferrales bacterium]
RSVALIMAEMPEAFPPAGGRASEGAPAEVASMAAVVGISFLCPNAGKRFRYDGVDKHYRRRMQIMTQGKSAVAPQKSSDPVSEPSADLGRAATDEISAELRKLLADVFALYLKTKGFHWHISGQNFRNYHLLLDEQAEQIFAMTDDVAERARKIGGDTLRSIGDITKHQRLTDNDKTALSPKDMLTELRTGNRELTRFLRLAHELCEKHNDVATASLIENWIDETEGRAWFLSEIVSGF